MARVLRGDVHWAELDPVRGREQAGRRPVLVISHDVFNQRSGTVIAMGTLTYKGATAKESLASETKEAVPSWVKKNNLPPAAVPGQRHRCVCAAVLSEQCAFERCRRATPKFNRISSGE